MNIKDIIKKWCDKIQNQEVVDLDELASDLADTPLETVCRELAEYIQEISGGNYE